MDASAIVVDVVVPVVNAIAALCLVGLVVFLARSSSRSGAHRGVLAHREYGGFGVKAVETYERNTVSLSLGVEVRPDRKLFVINAEGDPEDVKDLGAALQELLPTGSFVVTEGPERAGGENANPRAHVRFEVVRRATPEVASDGHPDFRRLDGGGS